MGATSTQQNPVHTYNNSGNYTVKLTVNNSYGSDEKTSTIIVSVLEALANLPSGLYNTSQTVNLTASDQEDPNPQIYYTLNGSDPTTNSTLYSGPINIINEGINTLKFRAFNIYGYSSDIVTRIYTLDTTAPTVTAMPSGGTYHTTQNVTLTSTDASSTTTYYTTDNTDPRSSKTRTVYSSPIALHTSTLLQFAALDAAGNWSPLYAQNYTMVDIASPVPSVDLPSGSYSTDQVAKLSAVDELDANPQIYYTLNGTNPTTNSTLYTWPVSINIVGTTVLKVIAVDAAGHISDVLTRMYSLDKPASSGTWNSTIVDSNVMYNSIVMDASGYPHIAYFQNANSGTDYPDLKYAYEDATGWHIETVESVPPGSGYYVSLALDSSGNPHIVYKQQFGDGYVNMLKYAYKDATGWHVSILTTSYDGNPIGDDIIYCNLVLYQNQPRISFYNYTGGEIEYMYNDGTKWITESVASTGGPWNSIVVDSSGNPKISYYSISPSSGMASLRYAQRTASGAWQSIIVDNSAENVGAWNSVALDSSGNPCISYIYNDGSLRYAYWNVTQWNSEIVDSLTSSSCKLILNPSNSPIIIYRDSTSSNLKYAYKEGSNWITHNVDTGDGASLWDSLALNSQGVPYVSYESKNSYLKYAYLIPFNASANPTGGTFNKTQTVNLTSTPGTSIYYTTDGSDPRTSSTKTAYSGSITVNNTTSLKFAAVDFANNWGSIYTQTYIIDTKAPVVTVDPVNGTYNTAQTVTLNTTDDSSTKTYYTLDGSVPTSASTLYSGPISINKNTTLKYVAVDAAGNWSPVYSQNYVIDTTAPTVKVVDPVNNAVNVSVGKVITVTFSEPVKLASGWFEIKNSNGVAVPFTKSVSGSVLTITPNSTLVQGMKYSLILHTGCVTDLVGNNLSLCGTSFTTAFDTVAPVVNSSDPVNGAVNVSVGKVITVTFSEPVKVGNGYIELKNSNGVAVPFTKSVSGSVLTITPNSTLVQGMKYSLILHTGCVTDLVGNNLSLCGTSFTTAFDTVAPVVNSSDPVNGAVNVSVGKVITVTFSEPVKVGNGYIELKNSNGTAVPFTKSIKGSVLTITPNSTLVQGMKYSLILHTGCVTDMAGNSLAMYVSKFTTFVNDTVPPTVKSVDPASNATGVALNKTITVTFSEPVKVGNGYIELKNSNGTAVPFTKSIKGSVLTITPSVLVSGMKYSLILHTGCVTDMAGNSLAMYVTKFTTIS